MLGTERTGKLPSKDVEVAWSVGGLSGTAVTDENGRFEIYVATASFGNTRQTVTISVSKTSGPVEHTFACDGIPCTSRAIDVDPLSFDNEVDFTDTSTTSVLGRVYIGGTEHNAFLFGCPLPGVKVCAVDHVTRGTLVCKNTDSTGHREKALVCKFTML